MNVQSELFNSDELDISTFEQLDTQPEEQQNWPALLLEIRGVLSQELKNRDIENEQLSLQLSLALGQYLGGAQFYLPKGDALQRFVRNIEIWDAFKGNNTKQLARQYKVTEKTIYEIVARMRKMELQRHQPTLFE